MLILPARAILSRNNKFMKTCPFCQLENDDAAETCQDCGTELGIFRKSTTRKDRLAYIIAAIHFIVSFMFGILALNAAAGRWGDSYHVNPSEGLYTSVFLILEAPLTLLGWVVTKCLPQAHFGLDGFGVLVFIAFLWSIVFGCLLAGICRKIRKL